MCLSFRLVCVKITNIYPILTDKFKNVLTFVIVIVCSAAWVSGFYMKLLLRPRVTWCDEYHMDFIEYRTLVVVQNILRTIFKNIQPQPKNSVRRSLKKI